VDQLGNFEDAVELAKTLAGIKGEVTLVYPKKPRGKWWNLFLQDTSQAVAMAIRDALMFAPRVPVGWGSLRVRGRGSRPLYPRG